MRKSIFLILCLFCLNVVGCKEVANEENFHYLFEDSYGEENREVFLTYSDFQKCEEFESLKSIFKMDFFSEFFLVIFNFRHSSDEKNITVEKTTFYEYEDGEYTKYPRLFIDFVLESTEKNWANDMIQTKIYVQVKKESFVTCAYYGPVLPRVGITVKSISNPNTYRSHYYDCTGL